MDILTKICVVVLVVLILIACPVFITQATVAPNYRHAYEQEVQRSKGFSMDARVEKLAHSRTKAEIDAALKELARIKQERDQEISRMSSNLASWQTKSASQENNLTALSADIAGLKDEAKLFNERNAFLAKQLTDARLAMNQLTEENINVSDLLKQAEAEKARLDLLAKGNSERIRELEEEIEELRKAGVAARPVEPEAIAAIPPEKITGTISAVKDNYASIDIGTAKGIRQEMKLMVHRGAQFVAYLRIVEVDVHESAGIITDAQLTPMQGDKVSSSVLE